MKSIWSRAKSESRAQAFVRVDGRDVPVIVRRFAQARGYRMRYDAALGVLRLSMPLRGGEGRALDWARTQAGWVAAQLDASPVAVRLAPGIVLPVEGIERLILWDAGHPRQPVMDGGELRVGGPEGSVGPRLVRWLRARALATLRTETLDVARRHGIAVSAVAIGDPRSRWGSCSASGAIRYSWRLILAPPEVRLATVAHEVAHRLHMDHSAAFHAAHRRLLGADPGEAREWLRRHGAGLHRFTA